MKMRAGFGEDRLPAHRKLVQPGLDSGVRGEEPVCQGTLFVVVLFGVVIGCPPVVFFTGPQKLAIDTDELSVAGGLAGTAIRKTRAVSVDLDVPADAEIVIEGVIDTSVLEPEAPFGESNG